MVVRLSLVPRETRFYELFQRQAELVHQALTELRDSLREGTSRHDRLRDIEHECDGTTHELSKLTNSTFTTPIETEEILALARSLDTVVDLAEEVSDKIDLYAARPILEPAQRLGECLAKVGAAVEDAVRGMETASTLSPALEEVHRLENEGDRITREALQELLNDGQPAVDVIKWKDLYDLLEATVDECESAAEIIETIAIKNT